MKSLKHLTVGLKAFCKKHNIMFFTRSRECGDIPEDIVKEWKEKLASVCEGYR